jgi:hypothetical protein
MGWLLAKRGTVLYCTTTVTASWVIDGHSSEGTLVFEMPVHTSGLLDIGLVDSDLS